MAYTDLLSHSSTFLSSTLSNDMYASTRAYHQDYLDRWRHEVDIAKPDMPQDREEEVVTNGIVTIPVSISSTANSVTSGPESKYDDEKAWYLEKYIQVKASDPSRPVYLLHNHPAFTPAQLDSQLAALPSAPAFNLTSPANYESIGSIPSASDYAHWDSLTSLFTPAIYHQREDVIVGYEQKQEVASATHIVLEYHKAEDASGLFGGRDAYYSVKLAAEGDNGDEEKGDVRVEFKDWEEAKEKYGKMIHTYDITT